MINIIKYNQTLIKHSPHFVLLVLASFPPSQDLQTEAPSSSLTVSPGQLVQLVTVEFRYSPAAHITEYII